MNPKTRTSACAVRIGGLERKANDAVVDARRQESLVEHVTEFTEENGAAQN
jgi:hypothetical protein